MGTTWNSHSCAANEQTLSRYLMSFDQICILFLHSVIATVLDLIRIHIHNIHYILCMYISGNI